MSAIAEGRRWTTLGAAEGASVAEGRRGLDVDLDPMVGEFDAEVKGESAEGARVRLLMEDTGDAEVVANPSADRLEPLSLPPEPTPIERAPDPALSRSSLDDLLLPPNLTEFHIDCVRDFGCPATPSLESLDRCRPSPTLRPLGLLGAAVPPLVYDSSGASPVVVRAEAGLKALRAGEADGEELAYAKPSGEEGGSEGRSGLLPF